MIEQLEVDDQAEFFSGPMDLYKEDALKSLKFLDGDACTAALDFEKKLGIDLFVDGN